MNKRKFILILLIVFLFSFFVSYKDLNKIYELKKLQEKINNIEIKNNILIEKIDKKTNEVEYLKEQYNFIETAKVKKQEKEKEIIKLKETIKLKEQEIYSLKNEIEAKQTYIEEIKKSSVN